MYQTPAKPRFLIPYQGNGDSETARFRPRFLEPELQTLDLDGYVLESQRIRVEFSFTEGGPPAANPAAPAPGETLRPPEPTAAAVSSPGTTATVAPAIAAPAGNGIGAGAGTGTETAAANRTAAVGEPSRNLEGAVLRYDELHWYEVLAFILVAFLYGAGHALT